MDFHSLHENLRLEILRRIDRGTLSGSNLARLTGFQQAHISNFLNQKRSLSLEGLDRVLHAQQLDVLDLLPGDAIRSPANTASPTASLTQSVAVVSQSAAATALRIQLSDTIETVEVPESILHLSRARPAPGRVSWQRFVAIRIDAQQFEAMEPILPADSIAVIDRHYNSLSRYRPHQPTIYAVGGAGILYVCYLDFDADRLILRPRNHRTPVRLMQLAPNEQPADRIVGRICYVVAEQ